MNDLTTVTSNSSCNHYNKGKKNSQFTPIFIFSLKISQQKATTTIVLIYCAL